MSIVVILMIGGWTSTLLMIGACALHESGKLRHLRRRTALWLDNSLIEISEPTGEGLRRGVVSAR